MTQLNDEVFCSQIRASLPSIKVGTLRIWGNWFGKPYDNRHRIVGCEIRDDHVAINFDGGETLEVWNAAYFEIASEKFEIRLADRVRWNWYCYGKSSMPENLYFLDYIKTGNKIDLATNVNWYTHELSTENQGVAVELL